MTDRFVAGAWNAICQRCGGKFKASELVLTWEGFRVCLKDWEPRHMQDFVKASRDPMPIPWMSVPQDPVFVDFTEREPFPVCGVDQPLSGSGVFVRAMSFVGNIQTYSDFDGNFAFWESEATSPTILPPTAGLLGWWCVTISADGAVKAGGGWDEDNDIAWIMRDGVVSLIVATGLDTNIWSLSEDGSVAVGSSYAVTWLVLDGAAPLTIGARANFGLTPAVSRNGEWVVFCHGGVNMSRLSTLYHVPTATVVSNTIAGVAIAVSDEGVVVGNAGGSQFGGNHFISPEGNAFMWTQAGGMTILGPGVARDITHNTPIVIAGYREGPVETSIVGGYTVTAPTSIAWVWDAVNGITELDHKAKIVSIARPVMPPGYAGTAPSPLEVRMCGERHVGVAIHVTIGAIDNPWETMWGKDISEIDTSGTVIGLNPFLPLYGDPSGGGLITDTWEPFIPYVAEDWPLDGLYIPLVRSSDNMVFAKVLRSGFTQTSWQNAAALSPVSTTGTSSVFATEVTTAVWWGGDYMMHDLDQISIGTYTEATAYDFSFRVEEE